MEPSKAWYIKFPGDAYALGPIRFNHEANETEVREYAKEWAGVKRLPKGFQCWPTDD
jgi:hypothetical protein